MANYKREFDLYCLVWRKKNRSHFEIIASMLEAMKYDDTVLYSIMKHAGVNYAQLKKYLKCLNKMGFIEEDIKDGRVSYRASERGLDFLRHYYVLLEKILSTHASGEMILLKPLR